MLARGYESWREMGLENAMSLVCGQHIVGWTHHHHLAVIEPEAVAAETRTSSGEWDTKSSVLPLLRNCSTRSKQRAWEILVSHRQHFVNHQNVRVDVHRNRKCEPHAHSARVCAQRLLDEFTNSGELDDAV